MGGEEATPAPGTPSSDSSPAETRDDESLQLAPVLDSPGQDPANNDPPGTLADDSLVEDKDSSDVSTTDLPLMDWVEFESEYKKALTDANEVEDQLVLEFEKLSKVGGERDGQQRQVLTYLEGFCFLGRGVGAT